MRIVLALYLFSAPVLVGSVARLADLARGMGEDPRYLAHPALAALHLLAGMVFLLVGPLQFLPRKGRAHRLLGYLFALSGGLCALGVIAMVFVFPALGGAVEQIATTALTLALLALLLCAIRAYGIGLTVATARWVLMLAAVLGVPFAQGFVPASAWGVALTLAAV